MEQKVRVKALVAGVCLNTPNCNSDNADNDATNEQLWLGEKGKIL